MKIFILTIIILLLNQCKSNNGNIYLQDNFCKEPVKSDKFEGEGSYYWLGCPLSTEAIIFSEKNMYNENFKNTGCSVDPFHCYLEGSWDCLTSVLSMLNLKNLACDTEHLCVFMDDTIGNENDLWMVYKANNQNQWKLYFSGLTLSTDNPYATLCNATFINDNIITVAFTSSDEKSNCIKNDSISSINIDINQATRNSDDDQMTDMTEIRLGLDPKKHDTDGDNLFDTNERYPSINNFVNKSEGYSTIVSAALGILFATYLKADAYKAKFIEYNDWDNSILERDFWNRHNIMGPIIPVQNILAYKEVSRYYHVYNVTLFNEKYKQLKNNDDLKFSKAKYAEVVVSTYTILLVKIYNKWIGAGIRCGILEDCRDIRCY